MDVQRSRRACCAAAPKNMEFALQIARVCDGSPEWVSVLHAKLFAKMFATHPPQRPKGKPKGARIVCPCERISLTRRHQALMQIISIRVMRRARLAVCVRFRLENGSPNQSRQKSVPFGAGMETCAHRSGEMSGFAGHSDRRPQIRGRQVKEPTECPGTRAQTQLRSLLQRPSQGHRSHPKWPRTLVRQPLVRRSS